MIFWETVMIRVLAVLISVLLMPTELIPNVEQFVHEGAVGSECCDKNTNRHHQRYGLRAQRIHVI